MACLQIYGSLQDPDKKGKGNVRSESGFSMTDLHVMVHRKVWRRANLITNLGPGVKQCRMWIFTVKYGGTFTLSHCGSQCAKHLVESSFCGTFKAGSSCSCKLVTSGSKSLCSGRKKLLTCSSVLKAFAKTMASERVTRKLYIFVSRLQDKHESSIKSYFHASCRLLNAERLLKRSFISPNRN